MCFDPFSMLATIGTKVGTVLGGAGSAGGLATALQVGGGLLGAYTTYQGAKSAQAAATANAAAADKAALEALDEGRQRSDKQRRAASLAQGSQKVAMAANGVDVSSSDAIAVLDETATLGEDDAFAIRENARRSAQGYSQQASNYRADAASARSEAFFGPFRTILGTAARVGSRYSYMAGQGAYS